MFAIVFANIFLFSSVSPLYSILNLQYDEQVYNLIGKGMKYGLVPYVDLIDHKGIYLFMIYALANIIGEWHHIGLFIVTFIINYVTAIFAYKSTMLLNNKNVLNSILVAFTIIFILNLAPLSTCGLDCETTIIPFLMISFYLILDFAFDDEKKCYPLRYIFIDGILAAIIIFIKANAAVFFFAKAIYLLIYQTKRSPILFVFGLLGMLVGLLPGSIYCISTDSLPAMINHSFIVNFKYMGALLPAASDHFDAFIRTIEKFWAITLLSIVSAPLMMHMLNGATESNKQNNMQCKNFSFFYIFSLALMLYIVFAPLRPYTHYLIFLLIYLIPVFTFLYSRIKINKITAIIIIILLSALSYPFNLKVGLETGKNQQVVVEKVKDIYEKLLHDQRAGAGSGDFKTKDLHLLVIGYAPYLYEAFDAFPDTPYFATPMVLMKDYIKPYEELLKAVVQGREDIIVTDYGINMIKGNPTYKDIVTAETLKNYKEVGRISQNKTIYTKRP